MWARMRDYFTSTAVLPPRTKHFSMAEFVCRDGTPVPRKYWANTQRLMEQLEVLREQLGGARIEVNSGYRSPKYNKRIGGASGSKHKLGMAADIMVAGCSPKDVADEIVVLIQRGKMKQGGLGRYRSFTHYDVRGKRARWGSNE